MYPWRRYQGRGKSGHFCLDCCPCAPAPDKQTKIDRWMKYISVSRFSSETKNEVLLCHYVVKWLLIPTGRWNTGVRFSGYTEAVFEIILSSSSNMGTMQQGEVGHFPGPTPRHRSHQAPQWLAVAPWGKNLTLAQDPNAVTLHNFTFIITVCFCQMFCFQTSDHGSKNRLSVSSLFMRILRMNSLYD